MDRSSTDPPPSEDRRVVRTRRTLRDALIGLIHEKGWDAISVQDICARADVGRSTFYTHFADKEELLLAGFDDLKQYLRAEAASGPGRGGRSLRFVPGLVAHVHDNRRLFRALVGKRAAQAVVGRFRQLVVDLVDEELRPTHADARARHAVAQFLAGGLVGLVSWSLDLKQPPEPLELSRLFHRLAAPALSTAGS